MKYIIKIGRAFYGLAMIVYGIQQFIYDDFRSVLFSPWQSQLPLLPAWAYAFGLYLFISGVAIITGKKGYEVSLLLGGVLLAIVCFVQAPYEMISEPNRSYHLALWTSLLKESALAGGGFIVAGTFRPELLTTSSNKPVVIRVLEKIIPYGSLFFCVTMISFGLDHFFYNGYVSAMVPRWIHDPVFWSYLAAVALIGSGGFIILNIRMRIIALLLAIMIFLWFCLLHLPGAIRDPYIDRGNNVSSAFDALAFSGIALLIAFTVKTQKWVNDIENYKGR